MNIKPHVDEFTFKDTDKSCNGHQLVQNGGTKKNTLTDMMMRTEWMVNQKRTMEQNRAIETAITDWVAMDAGAKAVRYYSCPLYHGNILLIGLNTEMKQSLNSFKSNNILFSDVKRRTHGLKKIINIRCGPWRTQQI